jgi:CRISPR/Cas system-associated exonuclease Cas4 (RecB family)
MSSQYCPIHGFTRFTSNPQDKSKRICASCLFKAEAQANEDAEIFRILDEIAEVTTKTPKKIITK